MQLYKLNKYKERFADLSIREQRMLAIGALSIAMALIYLFIYSPLHTHVNEMRRHINDNENTLAFMQLAQQEIESLMEKTKGNKVTNSSRPTPIELLSMLENQIHRVGLNQKTVQLKQTGKDTIQMHFQKVEFDKLLTMLVNTIQSHNVSITHMSAKSKDAAGIVSAEVSIKI